jgi:3-dehydroquinate dehydratase
MTVDHDTQTPATTRRRTPRARVVVSIIASLLVAVVGISLFLVNQSEPKAEPAAVKTEVQAAAESEALHAIVDQALADADVALLNAGALDHKSIGILKKAIADCSALASDVVAKDLIDCSDRLTIDMGAVNVAISQQHAAE